MREDLIKRLRSVKWEVTDDCDRMPDDPTHKCVFVDMRPEDFRALLREAADALEAAREDADRIAFLAMEPVIEGFVGVDRDVYDYACDCAEENGRDEPNDEDHINAMRRLIDAAIDQARGEGVQEVGNG